MNATEQLALYNRLAVYLKTVYDVVNIETMSWLANVAWWSGSSSTVSSTRRHLVDDLITGLKTDGVWSKLDRLWLFAAENTYSALFDIVRNQSATLVNSPTFTTDRGYTGDGAAAYINTNFNPGDGGIHSFVQNSAVAFAWNVTQTGAQDGNIIGHSTVSYTELGLQSTDAHTYWCINSDGSFPNNLPYAMSPVSIGLWAINRDGPTSEGLYINGTIAGTGAHSSAALLSETLWVLRGGSYYSTTQAACFGVGASLNATDQSNLYTRLRTYMTAVGDSLMIILTPDVANQVRGLTVLGHALAPRLLTDGNLALLEAVLNDPAHAVHHEFLRANTTVVPDDAIVVIPPGETATPLIVGVAYRSIPKRLRLTVTRQIGSRARS